MIRLCIVADSMIASSISAEMRDSTLVEAFRVCYTSECTPSGLCISTHVCNNRHHTLSMGTDRICHLHLSVLVLILSRHFRININLTVIRLSVLKKLIVTGSSLHSLVVGFRVIDTIRGRFALLYETDVLRVGLGWRQLIIIIFFIGCRELYFTREHSSLSSSSCVWLHPCLHHRLSCNTLLFVWWIYEDDRTLKLRLCAWKLLAVV